jgi:hypothetical protein
MILKLLTILLVTVSCNKKYDLESCNDLSMKKFKGFTDARKKFEENCTSFEVKYTHDLCQAALNDLILNNNLTAIKEKYGEPIENCFNEQDIKKYNK